MSGERETTPDLGAPPARRASVTSPAEGERIRAQQKIDHLRATLDAVEIALRQDGVPIGFDVPQHVIGAATDLALTLARLDALQRHGGMR